MRNTYLFARPKRRYRKFRDSSRESGCRFIMRCTRLSSRRARLRTIWYLFLVRTLHTAVRACHRLAVCKCRSIWDACKTIRGSYAKIPGITDPMARQLIRISSTVESKVATIELSLPRGIRRCERRLLIPTRCKLKTHLSLSSSHLSLG